MDGPVRNTRLWETTSLQHKGFWLEMRRSCLAMIVVHLGISYQVNCAVFFDSLLESFRVGNLGMD